MTAFRPEWVHRLQSWLAWQGLFYSQSLPATVCRDRVVWLPCLSQLTKGPPIKENPSINLLRWTVIDFREIVKPRLSVPCVDLGVKRVWGSAPPLFGTAIAAVCSLLKLLSPFCLQMVTLPPFGRYIFKQLPKNTLAANPPCCSYPELHT